MGVMTVPDVWSDQDRALTVEDMENMPDDQFRYELDDGVLIVSPAPSTLHQLAVARLRRPRTIMTTPLRRGRLRLAPGRWPVPVRCRSARQRG